MTQTLDAYIRARLEDRGLSGRAAASLIGISQPHFARIVSGQIAQPNPSICKRIAEFFGDPPAMVLRLAGWFEESDQDALLEEITEIAKKDTRFKEIVRGYQQLRSDEEREAFVAMARASYATIERMGNRGTTPGFSLTFAELLKELLDGTGESCRRLAKKSGLSHSAISKYLGGGVRPSRDACIALADHFGVNPNEMLEAAGYKSLAFFEKEPLEPGQVSRDIEELAAKIDQIADPRMRRRVIEAMNNLLDIYLALEGNA